MSPRPINPMASTAKPMPSDSPGRSRLKRCVPGDGSGPTCDSSRPSTAMASALSSEPGAITAAPIRPSVISAKASAGSNASARVDSSGATPAMSAVPTPAANNELSVATVSATPARPCRAIECPSMAVAANDDGPGTWPRMAALAPP